MVKPGEEVSLQIKTAPNSFVALTAVDESVLLLGSSNNFHSSQFIWLLNSYSTQTPRQNAYTSYPGYRSGVVTLTNANYFYHDKFHYRTSECKSSNMKLLHIHLKIDLSCIKTVGNKMKENTITNVI